MPATKEMKIEWFKNPKSLAEIYQQTGMLFSFVTKPKDGVLQACHEWVKCRDFLHDAVRSQITGKSGSIYGFGFDPAKNPNIDLKKTRMIVSGGNLKDDKAVEAFKEKLKASLKLLKHFERRAGVSLSTMKEMDPDGSGKKAVFLFTSPVLWMKSPFLVSMYTFLIRLGDKQLKFKNAPGLRKKMKELNDLQKAGKLQDNDARYLGNIYEKIHAVIDRRKELFPMKDGFHDIFFANYTINQFHNNGGIHSLCVGSTPDQKLNKVMKEMKVK